MSVYTHAPGCPARCDTRASCTCEAPRYLKAFCIGVFLMGGLHAAGLAVGSEALHADGWHLLGDVTYDILAYITALGVSWFPHLTQTIRRWGGRVHALLLLASALLIMLHLQHAARPEANGWVMLFAGAAATFLNWVRFRIVHPEGNPLHLLHDIFRSLIRGKREQVTFIGEVFHILTDVGTSAVAAVSGALVLGYGEPYYDELAAYFMAAILVAGVLVTFIFAHRHRHH